MHRPGAGNKPADFQKGSSALPEKGPSRGRVQLGGGMTSFPGRQGVCGQARQSCSKQKEQQCKARRQEVTLGLDVGVGVEREVGGLVQVK